jgi:hypothetical protein
MRSTALLPFCSLLMFLRVRLGAAFPLQTPAPELAATAPKESRRADSHSYPLPAQ